MSCDAESLAIAIVGMAGRFPGARNVREFWRNLRGGVESIRRFTDDELRAAGVGEELLADPNYVKAGVVLDDIDLFDAPFFGFSPRDASIMDPQHRHFLECAWEALENAGHTPEGFRGSIGVYAGSGMSTYLIYNLLTNRQLVESAGLFLLKQTGNDKDVLATRVSYQLDLRGPSINIQTACSTSLVAVHMACQSLLNHECDMALAGGVTIELPHGTGYVYREGEILSQDGHCRSFDAASTGTVFGSGLGMVVLRRLQDAIEDGDTIHAIVRGSAINNDGSRKVGYLAPSVDGQAEVIAEALAVAGVDAESISYIETHGTGTKVGDPIEISGLTQAFRESTDRKGFCAIGSVKSNIGHLDAAAGVTGLIKTVLALEHGEIPPTLHFEKPNPHIDFAASPFYVNAKLQEWKPGEGPRRAGVTSLGIGGTNAHVILEEAPAVKRREGRRPWQLLVLSAKTPAALEAAGRRLGARLREEPGIDLADAAFTCQLGRRGFRYRRALVCRSTEEAAAMLEATGAAAIDSGDGSAREAVFLFSGQGSQYVRMGLGLYGEEPVFRKELDRCAELLAPHLGLDLRSVLYPPDDAVAGAAEQLNQTGLTQPALFAVEYALAKLWMSWGVCPAAMAGHSIGEYVAACLAGVFSLEDALAVVAARGRLMQGLAAGAMTAVPLAEQEVRPLLSEGLALAAVNGPRQCVVSGTFEAVANLERELEGREISCRRLHTSHAFHSPMMEPVLGEFRGVVRQLVLRPPRIPYVSNLTGTWAGAEATDPEYWAKHLRGTVRFGDNLAEVFREPGRVLIEVGPGNALSSLARQHPGRPKEQRVCQSMRHPKDTAADFETLLNGLGQAWCAGVRPDWKMVREGDGGRRIPLPSYPFERKRHWIEPGDYRVAAPRAAPAGESAEWFYRRSWKQAPLGAAATTGKLRWLIFSDARIGPAIAEELRRAGHEVATAVRGGAFGGGEGKYTFRAGEAEDYGSLIDELAAKRRMPQRILHLWALDAYDAASDEAQDACFFSLLYLAQALGRHEAVDLEMVVVSDRMQAVAGGEAAHPESALLLGPCKVIPREYPGIRCRSVDVAIGEGDEGAAIRQIVRDALAGTAEAVASYRGGERWVEQIEPLGAGAVPGAVRLKERGVYLITGGLGGIALEVAGALARQARARLVLTGREGLPPREEWEGKQAESRKIRKVLELEKAGAEVLVVPGDVTRVEDMRRVVAAACECFGGIDTVIHAAGVLDDGLIQWKRREAARAVLAPKVKGTLALQEALRGANVELEVVFSSISAIDPPAGQVDYAAANAFLDAYARSRCTAARRTIAIDWGLWQEVGMASGEHAAPPALGHPLLESAGVDESGAALYLGKWRPPTHWLLAEHRFKNSGRALCPGTGYLEMACAAFGAPGTAELQDVLFTAPLMFDRDEAREVGLRLQKGSEGTRFSVVSRVGAGPWEEYASGTGGAAEAVRPQAVDVNGVAARCGVREIDFRRQKTRQEKYFEFGGRWRSLQTLRVGRGEGLAQLELPAEFRGDLERYVLHPALLDIATGCALYLIPGYETSEALYLPMSYRRLTAWGKLPARIYSHIRMTGGQSGSGETASFDITILDESGVPVVEIESYTLRRIADAAAMESAPAPARAMRQSAAERLRERQQKEGIPPARGVEALLRVLSAGEAAQSVVFSPVRPEYRTAPGAAAASQQSAAAVEGAGGEVEETLAGWWIELLGVEQAGPADDFFDLGGHSLIAVRLFTKIRKTYHVDLELAVLFEARTLAKLAAVIRSETRREEGAAPKAWSSLVPIQTAGSRPPFYFVSGVGGNVLNFQTLAKYLGPEQPVYALQPPGLDGKQAFLTRMEDIAAHYLREIKTLQPQGPYYFAGYSFGGFVTFEMAQQLHGAGEEVGLVVLLDTIEWRYWERVKHSLTLADRWELNKVRVGYLMDRDGRAHLWERLQDKWHRAMIRLSGLAGKRLPKALSTIADANWLAVQNYAPQVYPGPVTLVRCSERSVLDGDDALLGWGNLVSGEIEVKEVPGHHLNITKEPNVRMLAAALSSSIDAALPRAMRVAAGQGV